MSSALKNFNSFELSKKLVVACYALTASLPPEEKTSLRQYIRSSALNTHINILQCTFLRKKKKERKSHIRSAKDSLIVIDAAIEVLIEVKLATEQEAAEVMQLSSAVYQLLDRLQKEK